MRKVSETGDDSIFALRMLTSIVGLCYCFAYYSSFFQLLPENATIKRAFVNLFV